MKKFLALVLALVMTMSLVTIAGAEDYTDDSKITYEEAVDVMSAIGVVGGYADGSFNPTAGLTRGAAAKIICNMILGPTTAEALVANEAPYSDVAVDNVFAGYIAYCANEGIISGYADGTFKPAAPLTGYAFMKMLLGALGYDAAIEGYTGANWSIQVAKRALNIGLDDGLVGNFVGSKALTREEACLYAFNTLNSFMVNYGNKSSIVVGDITITTAADVNVTDDTFAETYFAKLDKDDSNVTDDLKRPAYTWYNGKTEIGTYTDTADYVLVLDGTYDFEGLVDFIWDETDNDKLHAEGADLFLNGAAADADDDIGAANCNTVIELFCNDENDDDLVTTLVAIEYSIGKIEDVSTSLTKAQKEDNTCKVKIGGGYVLDSEFAGFDAETYVEDAYVLYVKSGAKVLASELAEAVEGTVTATKAGKLAIDGVYYTDCSGEELSIDAEGTFYLNKAGHIVAFDGVDATSDNYAYVVEVDVDDAGKNADGYTTVVTTAYVVLADGTKTSYVVDADSTVVKGNVYAYSINADGEFEVETEAHTKVTSNAAGVDKDDSYIANGARALSTTEFIFVKTDDAEAKTTVKLATGYKAVDYTGLKTIALVDEDGYAVYAFVVGENDLATTEEDLIAVVVDADAVVTKDADNNKYYTYTVAVADEETELVFKNTDELSGVAAGVAFTYDLNGEYAENVAVLEYAQVELATADYVILKASANVERGYYNLGDETVYTITMEYEDEADVTVDTVTVSEGGAYEADAYVYFTLDEGELATVYVVEEIR